MNPHIISIFSSLVSSGSHLISGSFSDICNCIRTAALENISPAAAALFLCLITIPPAAWYYCDRVLIKGYRKEIIGVVARYNRNRDADQLCKDLRSMKYRPILRSDRNKYAINMSTALIYTGQPKEAMESLNRVKNADKETKDMVRHQRKEILKTLSGIGKEE